MSTLTTAPAVAAAAPHPNRILRLFPSLSVPHFRLLWLGMLPGTLGWQMSVVASGYAAFQLTGAATVLGLVSLAVGLPMLLFSLVGGVLADRFPRRTILLGTQTILGVSAGALALLALAGVLQPWHLVALGLCQGTAFAFNMPARQAYVAELVGGDLLRSAVALNNAGVNFCRIAGPAVAGVLLAVPWIGVAGVFVTMTVMYAFVLFSLLRLPRQTEAASAHGAGAASAIPGAAAGRADAPRKPAGFAQLAEGLSYIRSSPVLVALLGLAFAPLFFGMPFQTLMPVFAERVFEAGPSGLGALMAAHGVGALAGSLLVAATPGVRRPTLLQLAFGVAFGVSLVAFGLAPSLELAAGALLVVGLASAAYTALNSTLIMANTEPRLHGRVMSVYLMTFALMPVASMPAAWLADHFGAPTVVVGTGLIVAAVVAGVAVLYPPYRRIG